MTKLLGLPKRVIALACFLAFLLGFGLVGTAGATAVSTQGVSSPSTVQCISATPSYQVVNVHNFAQVNVEVRCLPPSSTVAGEHVQVSWGDGSVSSYPLCDPTGPVCDPPFPVNAMHAYSNVGDYHPLICLEPSPVVSPGTPNPYCTTVEIQVVSL